MRATVLALLTVGVLAAFAADQDPLARVLAMPQASLLVEEGGRVVLARRADRPMIPASTMKLLTGLAAIQRWGLNHRFETELYRATDDRLWVRGFGDPFLVSEELERMAAAVRGLGVESLTGIGADATRFAEGLDIPGRSASDNPYDAPVTALAANFNTVYVLRGADGLRSAEAQTPLTPLARDLAQGLPRGTHRVNLREPSLAPGYFAELLAAKLREAGVTVGTDHRTGPVPAGAQLLLRHRNSRDLATVVAAMLEHSNNFVANALFLMLGDGGDGRPVTLESAQQACRERLARSFGWRDFRVEEGAGLSRENRLSARQLVDVLVAFAPYREFLPDQEDGVRAKTGTLAGVSTYAGYLQRQGGWQPFALLINHPVPPTLRRQVAERLAHAPDLARACAGAPC
jgi:D-alanyl-D-alanine carboxypeptidase/D-alanyl-D-alanine-endopeptidase (penicillin-binding protein 4)